MDKDFAKRLYKFYALVITDAKHLERWPEYRFVEWCITTENDELTETLYEILKDFYKIYKNTFTIDIQNQLDILIYDNNDSSNYYIAFEIIYKQFKSKI